MKQLWAGIAVLLVVALFARRTWEEARELAADGQEPLVERRVFTSPEGAETTRYALGPYFLPLVYQGVLAALGLGLIAQGLRARGKERGREREGDAPDCGLGSAEWGVGRTTERHGWARIYRCISVFIRGSFPKSEIGSPSLPPDSALHPQSAAGAMNCAPAALRPDGSPGGSPSQPPLKPEAWSLKPEARSLKPQAFYLLSLAVYLALLARLGFLLCTALLVGVQVCYLRRRPWGRTLLVAAAFGAALSLAVFLVFRVLLQVDLPAGPSWLGWERRLLRLLGP